MLSTHNSAASITSRRSSIPPPQVSKALAGDGSLVLLAPVVDMLLRFICHCQGLNPTTKRLEVVTTANQDPLLTHVPIIGVDIWEHAFYLQYLNVKVDVRSVCWGMSPFHRLILTCSVPQRHLVGDQL